MVYNTREVQRPLSRFTHAEFYPRGSEALLDVYKLFIGSVVVWTANAEVSVVHVMVAKCLSNVYWKLCYVDRKCRSERGGCNGCTARVQNLQIRHPNSDAAET